MLELDNSDQELVPGQPWSKRASESMKAFQAFSLFRDLGPRRSLSKAAATLVEHDPERRLPTVRSQLKRWSAAHGWMHRAEAYDTYMDQQLRDVDEAEFQERRRQYRRASGHVLAAVLERFEGSPRDGVKPLDANDLTFHEAVRAVASAQQIDDRATPRPPFSLETVTPRELVKVVTDIYEILMPFVPEHVAPRAAAEIQRYIQTGKVPS